ncbi:rRNA maturation RNase YbeY [Aureibaculum sp. 2210JD6-5]|uniref:rRNA maturation RNase YbeY n=1 Tax=Aureibaculum sp. 2210JD6-5 TaxID=3103957 RepID=UPI002AADD5BA|nr:rRNA maturation RNase YbeY [Aureibaculum sp. 2210JD6-5]MDY7394682.1 rRNA maturation RNase YbeY [Aureibaculum sp. 2210JD6-5]
MIEYNYQKEFEFGDKNAVSNWISDTIAAESHKEDAINYIFCDDSYLLELNVKHLKHNTLTDIITFNYNLGKVISADIFISIDRIIENANKFEVTFNDELHRVMIHGILHLCGYKDNTEDEKALMRKKEDYYLSLRAF